MAIYSLVTKKIEIRRKSFKPVEDRKEWEKTSTISLNVRRKCEEKGGKRGKTARNKGQEKVKAWNTMEK